MGFIDRHLMAGEAIVHKSRLSAVIYVRPAFGLAAMTGAAIAVIVLSRAIGAGSTEAAMIEVCAWLAAAGTAFIFSGELLWRVLRRRTTEFAVSDRRVLMSYGVFAKSISDVVLEKIETVTASRGIIDAAFNSGSIRVIGSGGSGKRFSQIEDPMAFRMAIQEQIAARQKAC